MASFFTPFLGEHKKFFVINRLFETLFGGPRFFLDHHVPPSVYALQFLIHQIPFLVGGFFTILAENGLSQLTAACTCGILVALIVGVKQFITIRLHSCTSPVLPVQPEHKAQDVLEDGFVISETSFNLDAARYLFPKNKFFINYLLHSVLIGVLSGYGVVYFSPTRLSYLFSRSAIVYLIVIMGWMAHCTAVYSLSVRAPAETATFQLLDRWETKPLMRPFYVLVCYAVDLFAGYSSSLLILNAAMHIVLVFLPLLWLFNLLPPLEALFLWALEQINMWVAGGSPAVSACRLLNQLGLWISAVILIFLLPKYLILPLSAILGYLLSLDLGYLLKSVFLRLSRHSPPKFPVNWWHRSDFLFFSVMIIAVLSLALGLHFGIPSLPIRVRDISLSCLGWVLLLLFICSWIGSWIQSIQLFGDVILNCLYPSPMSQMAEFVKAVHKLRIWGHTRAILTYIAAPLVLNAYVTMLQMSSYFNKGPCDNTFCRLGYAITVLRAFRWPWQQTESALFEVVIVHFVIQFTNMSQQINDGTIILLFAALILDRFRNLLYKLHTFTVLLIASVAQGKQRHPYSWLMFGCNLLFFPIVFACLVAAAIISAPLLPFFTLPIFWIGFPRPISFWPKEDGKLGAPCDDSMYYEELIPELVRELSRVVANGSLGELRPGDEFLLRFEDRLIWLSVQEHGYGYCRITAKGLELQQTSCHTAEALAIDTILERSFGDRNRMPICGGRMQQFQIFWPVTATIIKTYVDTHNVLTGVINSKETLQLISDAFPKCLIWILLNHFKDSEKTSDTLEEKQPKKVEKIHNFEPAIKRPSTAERYAQLPKVSANFDPGGDEWCDEDDILGDVSVRRYYQRPSRLLEAFNAAGDSGEKMRVVPPNAKTSLPGTISDDFGMELGAKNEDGDFQLNEKKLTNTIFGRDARFSDSLDDIWPDALSATKSSKNNFIDNVALNTTSTKYVRTRSASVKSESSDSIAVESIMDDNNVPFPVAWLTSLVAEDIDSHKLLESPFPFTWFRLSSQKIHASGEDKSNLRNYEHTVTYYKKLVGACCSAVEEMTEALSGKRKNLTPTVVHCIWNQELPSSPLSDWLIENSELCDIVMKAFRYACKIGMDQSLLGGVASDSELMDYLEEYDKTWYLGCDAGSGWLEAVKCRIPNLFSLGLNLSSGIYTSHLLTRHLVPVYIGRLNKEAVRAVWSTLNFELLYLTNDDEERYSIQAHTALLRNLTVQGADPPLGYPIYMAQNILVKTMITQAFL